MTNNTFAITAMDGSNFGSDGLLLFTMRIENFDFSICKSMTVAGARMTTHPILDCCNCRTDINNQTYTIFIGWRTIFIFNLFTWKILAIFSTVMSSRLIRIRLEPRYRVKDSMMKMIEWMDESCTVTTHNHTQRIVPGHCNAKSSSSSSKCLPGEHKDINAKSVMENCPNFYFPEHPLMSM